MNSPGPDLPDTVEVTQDTILGGRLQLSQPAKGHRAGTDAVLLAAATPVSSGLIVDAGAGVGTAGLVVAMRDRDARVVLLEREPIVADLARRNVVANGFGERVIVVAADLLSKAARREAGLENGRADIVLTNPPFYASGRGTISTNVFKRAAHAMEGSLSAWVVACLMLLRHGGTLVLIHKPDALPELLATIAPTCGNVALRAVQPRADAPAHRLLLTCIKESRGPLTILPPLVLHDAGGKFLPQIAALHDGTATALT